MTRLVDFIENQNAVKFNQNFNDLMTTKVSIALENEKEILAKTMFDDQQQQQEGVIKEAHESIDPNDFGKHSDTHDHLKSKYGLYHVATGEEHKLGQKLTDFRGDYSTVSGFQMPHHAGSSGRVETSSGSYFPHVFGLEIRSRNHF